MKIQSLLRLALLTILLAAINTSCVDFRAVVASSAGDACIRVPNYISPEYELHVRTGISSMKQIEYQESKTFYIPVKENSNYARTDLSAMVVDKATNRTVNSHKEEVSFRKRDVGCAIIQISNPDEIRFDIE
ncbi:MAG: hypothetical protein WD335_00400 [Candidatus Paceibacterota bacterium]